MKRVADVMSTKVASCHVDESVRTGYIGGNTDRLHG